MQISHFDLCVKHQAKHTDMHVYIYTHRANTGSGKGQEWK